MENFTDKKKISRHAKEKNQMEENKTISTELTMFSVKENEKFKFIEWQSI